MKAEQDAAIKTRLEAEREAAAKRVIQAVNAEKTKGLAERLKLTERLEALRSRLERLDRPAGQLGEEGELDAFTLLSEKFSADGDEITRTKKFTRGGDIEHQIANAAGLILYEIKNHQQYQSKWTARAKENQLAAQADHVVIVTNTFPGEPSRTHAERRRCSCRFAPEVAGGRPMAAGAHHPVAFIEVVEPTSSNQGCTPLRVHEW
jgi:hypothetical protein